MGELATVRRRLAFFACLLLLVLVTIVGRLAWVQFIDGEKLAAKAQQQLQESMVTHSPRGTIYDRNGKELAVSQMTKSLYAHPHQIQDPDGLAAQLAPYLEQTPEAVREKLSEGVFVWLKRKLDPDKSAAIAQLIETGKINGLGFVEESKRYYPNDSLAAHVLGFVGTDDMGLDGIELALDKQIQREELKQTIETDSYGKPIFQSIFSFVPPKQNKSVYLTIDSGLQHIVEKELDKAMVSTGAQGAIMIAMDPRTGEILAMASRPTFNPNQFYRYSQNELKNRAVSIVYEPGSTFKPVVTAAALQEGLVSPTENFVDTGYVEVSGRQIRNWSGEAYGTLPFVDIFKNSINTGFVHVGMRLGAVRLNDYVRKFGFGKPTGIELAGEESGILFNPAEMRDSDLATMSIGQSIAVTPLQLITAISAIANNGVLLQPHIVKTVQNMDGTQAETVAQKPVRQVISPAVAQTLTGMMEKVITEGGGKIAGIKGYRFAGKTGTAEKIGPNGGYLSGHYIASFVGFGPVEDPQVTVLIVLDDPAGQYYGSMVAAPVFHEVMTQFIRYLGFRPSGGSQMLPPPSEEENQKAAPKLPAATVRRPQQPAPPGKVLVPELAGKTMREAGDALNQLGLSFLPVGTGVAASQNVPAGTVLTPGDEVQVFFEAIQ